MADPGVIFSTPAARKIATATRGYNGTPVDGTFRPTGRRVQSVDVRELVVTSIRDGVPGVYNAATLEPPDDPPDYTAPLTAADLGKNGDAVLFVHWAEMPSVSASDDGTVTHVLADSTGGTAATSVSAVYAWAKFVGMSGDDPPLPVYRGWADRASGCTVSDVGDLGVDDDGDAG